MFGPIFLFYSNFNFSTSNIKFYKGVDCRNVGSSGVLNDAKRVKSFVDKFDAECSSAVNIFQNANVRHNVGLTFSYNAQHRNVSSLGQVIVGLTLFQDEGAVFRKICRLLTPSSRRVF